MGRGGRRNGRGDLGDAGPPDPAGQGGDRAAAIRSEFLAVRTAASAGLQPGGALPITKASDRLQVHVTSVTHAIRRLEANGLVERVPHPTDGRTTLVRITELGRSTVEDATVTLNEQVFADVGMSDEQSRALVASIETLRRHSGDF